MPQNISAGAVNSALVFPPISFTAYDVRAVYGATEQRQFSSTWSEWRHASGQVRGQGQLADLWIFHVLLMGVGFLHSDYDTMFG